MFLILTNAQTGKRRAVNIDQIDFIDSGDEGQTIIVTHGGNGYVFSEPFEHVMPHIALKVGIISVKTEGE